MKPGQGSIVQRSQQRLETAVLVETLEQHQLARLARLLELPGLENHAPPAEQISERAELRELQVQLAEPQIDFGCDSLNSRLILIVVIDNDRVGDNLLLEEQLRHSQNRQLQANKED